MTEIFIIDISVVSALPRSHPWKHSNSIQSNANSISGAWSGCGWILALHSMAVVTNFILKLPLSLSANPKFTPLRSPHSLFSPPIFAKPQSLTKPKTSRTQLLITKATAAPGTKNAPRDERVKKVHSIEEFDEALRLAKNKLVVVEFAASRSLDSSKIYPFMVDLSRQCNDVEFILVMGDEMNGDENDSCMQFLRDMNVVEVPTFLFIRDGQIRGRCRKQGQAGRWDNNN
ncbi:Thioredoxin-like protein CDSP32 [Citrus sinensis]|uniref:Thioredoxin-like protein CDSP32 n=1 Tax=Citrus sinensis TaxID=2711 RepID=A0ACB8KYA5_CITSI|nr:Thioredoxin-like protein CDSP32 [Citrus sinensis]KAH9759276.1 Thioredoxin-like protein CDSP32 [Citrus sinensis]